MKNNIGFKLIIGGFILFLFCVGVAFFWYRTFQKDKVAVATLMISLKDHGEGVKVKELSPLTDSAAKALPAYTFEISNSGDHEGRYEVLIEDSLKKDTEDTSSFGILTRDQLKYELTLNNKVIAKDMLSEVKKNILDTRVIAKGSTNTYQLRIWIPMDVEDWQNKMYHYKVSVNPINEEE